MSLAGHGLVPTRLCQQLIAASAVEQVTLDAGTPGNGAMGWWSNKEAAVGKLPKDAFWGSGAGHQVLLVVPSLRLIAVRNGESLSSTTNYDAGLREYFFDPLLTAINHGTALKTSQAACPPSPV